MSDWHMVRVPASSANLGPDFNVVANQGPEAGVPVPASTPIVVAKL